MIIPEITPRAFFGLRSDVKQNAHYISDFQVLYPAGSVLVFHNYYEKRQKYIKLYEKSLSLELITISNNRKYAALVENSERGNIVIYDLLTFKKRRTLNLPPDASTNRFETVTFTHDDKYLIAITGDPDWTMVSYHWEKGKAESSAKAIYPNNPGTIVQVCCSPSDNSQVCIVGPGVFRLLIKSETVWRIYGFQKADQINFTCACWLNGEEVLCGTADGKLLLLEGGELKAVFNAVTVNVINIKEKNEAGSSTSSLALFKSSSEYSGEEDRQVRGLICFGKGFAFSCKTGYVHMFEKESSRRYRRRNVFRIVDADFRESLGFELNTIKHLTVNVSQDKLLATTNRAQIYTVRLWGPDIHVAAEIPFKILGEPLHHGTIAGLSMCVWKPIFLSCGEFDRTVRLWNYETQTVELVKQFDEDIFSISLHPTGYFAAIGFTERLRFMIVLLDDIQPRRDFPIRECSITLFSNHGHLLAAAKQPTIEVYNYVSFQNVFTLKGHEDDVQSVAWSGDDKKLLSCSKDGTIIIWDMIEGQIISEVNTPEVSYTDCAISSDGKNIYAVGNDGLIREVTKSNVVRTIDMNQKNLDRIVLSRSDVMMFVCGDNGSVLSVRMPLSTKAEFTPYFYHYSNITHMKLSFDDQTLVTASLGGTIIIWKLSRTEGKAITVDKDFAYSKDVLISKVQLQDKINFLKNLGVRLFDLEMNHATLMRQSEYEYSEKIREIQDTYNQVIEELKEKMDQIETDQENQLMRIGQDLTEMKEKQEKEKNDLETNYKAKLDLEHEKLEALNVEKDGIELEYKAKVDEVIESKELETFNIVKLYEDKIIGVNQQMQQSFEESAKNIEEHNRIKQLLEDDADREIIETKAHYERILKDERGNNELLKQEAAAMKKQYIAAQKEIDDQRLRTEGLQAEHQKHQNMIQSLEKDILDLKKEIEERDLTIDDKDKRISDLKQKIQELEKFKMVLDFKIKELKNQIDPKDREIRERKEQIEDMEKELENLQKINTSLSLQAKELKEKIAATEKEATNYEGKYNSGSNVLRQMKIDLYNLYQNIEDFKVLKDGIKNIYLRYNQDEVFIRGQSVDSDLQKEFMIQREFLEKTILSLQSTLRKNRESKKNNRFKVMEDNVVLVEELNHMRRQLKDTMRKLRKLENLLGIKGAESVTPREAFIKLQQCLKKHEAVTKEYDEVAEEARKETAMLNDKISELYDRIEAMIDEGDK